MKRMSLPAQLGGTIGNFFGGPMGGRLGSAVGGYFGRVTGLGAYRVNRNSLMTASNGPPSFGNIGSGTVLSHREFLQDITGSTGFVNTSFPLNAGLNATFPWLAAVAINYEQYEFLGLVFEYRPTSATSVGSTNTAQGTVVMATDYDSYDTLFTSKQQMEAYEFCTSCAPYSAMYHPIECKPSLNNLSKFYVRSGLVPTGADTHFYDIGNFQLATVGMQAAANIGELWVTYHVRLLKPKLPTPLGAGLIGAHIVEFPATTCSATNPLGSGGGALRSGSNLGVVTTPTTFTLPQVGQYLIAAGWVTTGVSSAPTFTYGGNITQLRIMNDNGYLNIGDFHVNSSSYNMVVVTVAAPGTAAANTVTITISGMSSGQCDIFIQQTNSALLLAGPSIDSRLLRLESFLSRFDSGEEAKDRVSDDHYEPQSRRGSREISRQWEELRVQPHPSPELRSARVIGAGLGKQF